MPPPADWPAIWPILHEIVAAGDTFSYAEDVTEEEARAMWLQGPPGRTTVAPDGAGAVVGSANMCPNHAGPGAHVASGNFMVDRPIGARGWGERSRRTPSSGHAERAFARCSSTP